MQNYAYEMAHKNGFRCKSACQFAVKPTAECSTRVEDFSCPLYFQQNGHTEDFIYVNPGIPLLPPQVRVIETAARIFPPLDSNICAILYGNSQQPGSSCSKVEYCYPSDKCYQSQSSYPVDSAIHQIDN